ncbi:hydantoinase/oxoprolinase N-terminal domain-containing protein [Kiloniella majae]|uniref:hydantoinase/oxoprolinase N-terminal domain-containing protein n=1 Tax=Kiloniella majae TaxID=1938558 RepID=UPI000A277F96|nr:hydantoinase/oxoprolinase family protein [Kiloniella majae]
MLLGIDTGGTYTDAVLFTEEDGVLRTAKSLTTKHDLSIGICDAVNRIMDREGDQIRMVSLSTTLATNAIVEAHDSPVCLIMIGYDKGSLERSNLGTAIGKNPYVFIDGGHTPLGDEQSALDIDAVQRAIDEHAPNVSAFAVAGYFSVRNASHEETVRNLILEKTDRPVTCAHELSSGLDAPRRALTAFLNAQLIPQLHQLIHSVDIMLQEKGIKAPVMVVKGDGSLISAQTALERPVETILSGPAASVVGAKYLSGASDVFVVDMGGTTTDIAILMDGEPKLSEEGANVGGWRTMVKAVAVSTYGLGGDSEVALNRPKKGLTIGPRRAYPISLLAQQHPGVLGELQEQLRNDRIGEHDGRFALKLRELNTALTSLSRLELEIWENLADGPVALNSLLERPAMAGPLQRLIDRGLVINAGLTPSDSSHILNKQNNWTRDGALFCAQLFLRQAQRDNYLLGVTPDDLAEMIYQQTVVQAGKTILDTAFIEENIPKMSNTQSLGMALLDNALNNKSDTTTNTPLLDFTVKLGRGVVATGAPSAIYYPEITARLNTELNLPENADVSNAVGAVCGGVVQKYTVMISSPEKGRFRTHMGTEQKNFTVAQDAIDYAKSHAEEKAYQMAEESGATDIIVEVDQFDKIITDAGGDQLFIESAIIATAKGRPVLMG